MTYLSKSKYITDPFFKTLAMRRGLTSDQVLTRSERRRRACLKLGVDKDHVYMLRFENPFIYSHAWKFLVRESLRNKEIQERGRAHSE